MFMLSLSLSDREIFVTADMNLVFAVTNVASDADLDGGMRLALPYLGLSSVIGTDKEGVGYNLFGRD